jgi:HSP20 family protein
MMADVPDTFTRGAADLAEDARKLLIDIDSHIPGSAGLAADCRPPLDVIETATTLEVVVDVAGVAPEALRVMVRRDTLLVVGAKLPASMNGQARYHVAERSYGQFARAVRLSGAFDAGQARATVHAGVLRVALPRVADRRGQPVPIAVERA